MIMKRLVAIVTTLQPETHYSRYLIEALGACGQINLIVYADKDPRNRQLYENARLVWTPTYFFPFQIALRSVLDRPAIVHVQHEINMYGGPFTAVFFPLLLLLLRITGRKVIVTIHSVVPKNQIDSEFMRTFSWPESNQLGRFLRAIFASLYWSIGLMAERVVVHSHYMAEVLKNDYGVLSQKVAVIPIGVPPARKLNGMAATGHSRKSLPDAKKAILYFGYITRRKGLEYLIEAFRAIHSTHSDYALVLAGGELEYQREYARGLREQVAREGLGNATLFTSFISQPEIEKLYARCEFVVLPYTYSISSSLPLAFAMQYGKPIVATRLGTLAEEIDDGVNGLLVPARDAQALAAAMLRLITDGDLLRRLSEGSRLKAQQRSWASAAALTLQVYRSESSS
jgi:glycosyltransferase involved in cell wall biosynthesis